MPSFFEKLKNSIGVEVEEEEKKEREEKEREEETPLPAKKIKVKAQFQKEPSPPPKFKEAEESSWFEPEGELAVDVYQTDGEIVIQSTIAGVQAEDLDVSIENDVVTIRGERRNPNQGEEKSYFYQECYWGPFSRQIILPEEVDASRAEAEMKEGILTLRFPKLDRQKIRRIKVRG